MRWWEIVGSEEPSGDTPSVSDSLASSLREGAGNGGGGGCHSTGRPETVRFRAIFIAPTKLRIFYHSKIFRFLTQKRYRVGQGTHVWEPAQSVIKKA